MIPTGRKRLDLWSSLAFYISATTFTCTLAAPTVEEGDVPFWSPAAGDIPLMIPIRYDLQIQLPTASDKDPLIPTFFGAIRMDFQLMRTITPRFTPYREEEGASRFSETEGVELRLMASQLEAFENITLREAGANRDMAVVGFRIREAEREVAFQVAEPVLPSGRYSLTIGKYQGLITYDKGIYYRDAGGYPVLGSDLFPNYTHTVFPCLGGPLTKTTLKLSLVHPRDTVAVSNMQQQEPTEVLNESWKVSKFVQAPNIASYMVTMAVLPEEVYERTIVSTQTPIYIWTNKIIHRPTLKQEIAKLSGHVFLELNSLLGEQLPISHIEINVMNEFNGTHSFGLVTISYEQWEGSDEAHRLALLARNFARQWLGGMTTISSMSHFCFQEDLVEYLATKVVRRLLKDTKEEEKFMLASYVRLQVAETFLAPGESVIMSEEVGLIDQYALETHCGFKGAQMLQSLESVTGEEALLDKIRYVVRQQRYRAFTLENFLDLLRGSLVDNIDLGQVFDFWFKSGGIPNVFVEKKDVRLRLTQLNQGRHAQVDGLSWGPMPLWPLRVALRNESLPVTFMLSQMLELAPLDKKLLPLMNVDFEHLYRVNYDAEGWASILSNIDSTFPVLSARSRAQLLNDFCYFSAMGQLGEKADELRMGFLRLLRNYYEHFELCELYTFWCVGGHQKRINMDKVATRTYYELVRSKVWPALWNSRNYECGGPGAASDASNQLCRLVFGVDCL